MSQARPLHQPCRRTKVEKNGYLNRQRRSQGHEQSCENEKPEEDSHMVAPCAQLAAMQERLQKEYDRLSLVGIDYYTCMVTVDLLAFCLFIYIYYSSTNGTNPANTANTGPDATLHPALTWPSPNPTTHLQPEGPYS